MKLPNSLAFIVIVLTMLGIVFLSLLVHEYTHILQSIEPVSICYDMQQKIYMSTIHNISHYAKADEWELYTEKWAQITMRIVQIGLSILIGFMLGFIGCNEWGGKNGADKGKEGNRTDRV